MNHPTIFSRAMETPAVAFCCYCLVRDTPMMRCTRCRLAQYCSRECQRADWREHRDECAPLVRDTIARWEIAQTGAHTDFERLVARHPSLRKFVRTMVFHNALAGKATEIGVPVVYECSTVDLEVVATPYPPGHKFLTELVAAFAVNPERMTLLLTRPGVSALEGIASTVSFFADDDVQAALPTAARIEQLMIRRESILHHIESEYSRPRDTIGTVSYRIHADGRQWTLSAQFLVKPSK